MTTKRKGPPRLGPRAATRVAPPPVDEPVDETPSAADEVAGAVQEASEAWAIPGGVAGSGGSERPEDALGDGFSGPAVSPPPRRELSPELARVAETGIVIGGAAVATLLAAVLAIIEAFYSPFRVGGVLVPVSLVLALVTNPLLAWFASSTTKRRMMALLPAGAWCIVWVLAAGRTSEGDMVVTQSDWVGLLTLFSGPLAFAVTIYVASVRRLPPVVRPDGVNAAKKGSGTE